MSFSFIHAADLHLDSPFSCLSNTLPDELKEALVKAPYIALERLRGLALEKGVSFCILAGDIFDSGDHSLSAQTRFLRETETLWKNGITTFIVLGNHDTLDTSRLSNKISKGITIFGSELECHMVKARDGTQCAISGVSYKQREEKRPLARLFHQLDLETKYFSIGVLHTNCGGVGGHGNYAPSTLADLTHAPVDYWALGHIHRRLILKPASPAIAYPGVTQGRNFRETGAKGCYLVTVEGSSITIHTIDLSTVRWLDIEIWLERVAKLDDLQVRISEELLKKVVPSGENDPPGQRYYCIVRLHLAGATSIKRELIKEEVILDLKEALNEALFHDHGVWVDDIVDDTKKTFNINQLPPEGLPSEIFGASNQILSSKKARERLMSELSPLLKKRDITKNAGDLLRENGLESIVNEARDLLFDLLEDDE